MKEKKRRSRTEPTLKTNSWADLDLNLLGEIKKKLYWGDHARFSGVCKTWVATEHEKRASDVLPWCLLLYPEEDVNKITYHLYEPLNLNQPVISRGIDLDDFFDPSTIHMATSLVYFHGCLFVSMYHIDYTSTHFLLVSIPTNTIITLPQFHHPSVPAQGWNFKVLKSVSTYPASPDCVFLALHVVHYHHWTIAIFRHGHTHWTTTEFNFVESFGYPMDQDPVFIRGLFYILCYNQQLASYDIASGELKIVSFSIPTDGEIYNQKFFALDGDLMLLYYDSKVRKHILTTYDWSHKLWVPLKSLGDRSLFISDYSVYVDSVNYYGVSPNMIYYQHHGICCVYSFENGQLLKSTSSGLRNWDGLDYGAMCSVWVEPPDLLSKLATTQQKMTMGGYNGRMQSKTLLNK